MKEKKESKIKIIISNLTRPFRALIDNNEDEKEIEQELFNIKQTQKSLEVEKDYMTNIKLPKTNQTTEIKQKNIKQNPNKKKDKDIEIDY